jgi:hypothetical protein
MPTLPRHATVESDTWQVTLVRPGAVRRAVHPFAAGAVTLVGVSAAVLVAVGGGPARGIAVGAAALLVPGTAALPDLAARWSRAARFSWAVAVSIVAWAVVAIAMAFTQAWYPRTATAVLAGGGAVVVAIRLLRGPRGEVAGARPASPHAAGPAHAAGTVPPDAPPPAPTSRRLLAALTDLVVPAAAVGLAAGVGALSDGANAEILALAAVVVLAWTGLQLAGGARGGTPGQLLAGLRVVDAASRGPLGLSRYAARWGTSVGRTVTLTRWLPERAPGEAGQHASLEPSAVGVLVLARDARLGTSATEGFRATARRHGAPAASLLVAGVVWAVATVRADVVDLGDWGLTPALGPLWFGALALTLGTLAVGLLRRVPEGWLAAHLALLVLMLYGTPALVEDVPRLPWSFKHIAVTRYIEANGSIDWHGDIYQRWPGMFAWTALLGQGTGYQNPVHWQYLAEIGFALLDVILVVAIARALAPSSRWAWAAATFYAVSNWVGQNYFAPQGLAYALYLFLALLAVLQLSAVPRGLGTWLERLVTGRRRRAAAPPSAWPARSAQRPVPAVVVVAWLATFAVVVVSHQLTPYVALLALGPLFVMGYLRPLWVAVSAGLLTLGYLAPQLGFVNERYGLLSSLDVVNNATYSAVDIATFTAAETWQRRGTLALAAAIIVLGLAGIVRRLVSGEPRQALVVGWLTVAPVLVMAGQSYGGEIRLRAYLFALPWAAIGAGWLFAPLRGRRPWWTAAGYPLALVSLTTLFTLTYFQPAAATRTSQAAVDALEWVDEHAQPGDVVFTSGSSPASIGAHYLVPTYNSISLAKQWVRDPLQVADVAALARATDPDARRIVLITTDTSLQDPTPSPLAPGELARLMDQMLASPGAAEPFQEGDTHVVVVPLPD